MYLHTQMWKGGKGYFKNTLIQPFLRASQFGWSRSKEEVVGRGDNRDTIRELELLKHVTSPIAQFRLALQVKLGGTGERDPNSECPVFRDPKVKGFQAQGSQATAHQKSCYLIKRLSRPSNLITRGSEQPCNKILPSSSFLDFLRKSLIGNRIQALGVRSPTHYHFAT